MRSTMIAGNWKMNTSIAEAKELAERMRPRLDAVGGVTKVVCPPFVALAAVRDAMRGSSIALGAQNMYHERSGAYTGEVSPTMLAGLCEFVIVGHSERRHILGESDRMVGKKVAAAMGARLRPILCVGENLREREDGNAEAVMERQVHLGLADAEAPGGLVVAYEPVWAIGSGRAATPGDAEVMMAHIRRLLAARFGDHAAADIPLLYGGSVTAGNVADFVRRESIDGALVGGASLDADSFVNLVRGAAAAARSPDPRDG